MDLDLCIAGIFLCWAHLTKKVWKQFMVCLISIFLILGNLLRRAKFEISPLYVIPIPALARSPPPSSVDPPFQPFQCQPLSPGRRFLLPCWKCGVQFYCFVIFMRQKPSVYIGLLAKRLCTLQTTDKVKTRPLATLKEGRKCRYLQHEICDDCPPVAMQR